MFSFQIIKLNTFNIQAAKSTKPKASRAARTPRGKISIPKTPASKRKFVHADDDDDDDEEDDYDAPAKKRGKKKAAVANLKSSRASSRSTKKAKYHYESGESASRV